MPTAGAAIHFRIDPFPSQTQLTDLMSSVWGRASETNFEDVLRRSLGHVCAYSGEILLGFVNIAWDGGQHAFLLDTSVHPDFRHRGIATGLVKEAVKLAKDRQAEWLHVDFEPHLTGFYRSCGFRPTEAGLIRL